MAVVEELEEDGTEAKDTVLPQQQMARIEEEELQEDNAQEPLTSLKPDSSIVGSVTTIPASSNRDHEGYKFKKWLKSLRKKPSGFAGPQRYVYGWPENEALDESYNMLQRHDSSRTGVSSTSSSSILHAVRTASISITSQSTLNRARTNTLTSTKQSGYHSSGPSGSDGRISIDSNRVASPLSLDEGTWNRAVQRRQIIGEMLDTETTYVAGLKALSDVLSTMVVTRSGLHRSADDLLSLHENLLSVLQGIACRSNTGSPFNMKNWSAKRRFGRTNTFDSRMGKANRRAIASRKLGEPVDSRIKACKSIVAEPKEAAEVAELLLKMLPQFSAYEEYGLKYQLAIKEIDLFRKSLSNSESMDQGIEALVKSTAPPSTRQMYGNQGLTLADLLMKPIQRVCKYQLFLADLLKGTPAMDCPASHETIDRILQRVIEVVHEVNRGTGDPVARDRLQKTIRLQDMISFSREHTGERDLLHDFGHLKVCGVLHIAYETQEKVKGEYMMCALFGTHLLLAGLRDDSRKFSVVAMIRTSDIELKAADDGAGLCCEGAPYSWKIVFCDGDDIFELAVSACSAKEATQWKEHLLYQEAEKQKQDVPEANPFLKRSTTFLGLRPRFAGVFERDRPGMERRSSTNTVLQPNPNTACIDLIIRGTEAVPQGDHAGSSSSLGRSRSLNTDRRTAVLAPKRQDRIRMERQLSVIWTRDVIPYPGMQPGRGEHMIRSSAESLMRKFSRRKPFMRLVSPGMNPVIRVKSTESVTLSKEDPVDEKGGIGTHSETAAADETSEKFTEDMIPSYSPRVRSGGKCKTQLVQGVHEDGRIRGNRVSLRKRLSMSLFRAQPVHSGTHRTQPAGY